MVIFYFVVMFMTIFGCLVASNLIEALKPANSDETLMSVLFSFMIGVVWPISLAFVIMFALGYSLHKAAQFVADKIKEDMK